MTTRRICLVILGCFLGLTGVLSQSQTEKDTLYEGLKKKNINKMTQREYEYFMLMKRKEVDSQSQSVAKEGVLTGVATYFFNDNYGDKPDVGSEVFALPVKYEQRYIEALTLVTAAMSKENVRRAKALGVESRGPVVVSESEFMELEKRVGSFIDSLRYGQIADMSKAIADGGGSFSFKLPAGQFYLIARSAHRSSSSNKVEMWAQIQMTRGMITVNQTTSVLIRFQAR